MLKSIAFPIHRAVRVTVAGSRSRTLGPAQLLHCDCAPRGQARRTFRAQSFAKATPEQEKVDLDRHALDPETSEAVKTGTDNEVGSDSASYDPRRTTPDSELHDAANESQQRGKNNPLEVSGANEDVSRGVNESEEETRDRPKKQPSGKSPLWKRGVVNERRK